ncbi:MAG TPA: hypothetical protein VHI99_11685 [Vicinamibacterales bacterium]|nr:hypothetical protein [Vicinamibacterales bacterium]
MADTLQSLENSPWRVRSGSERKEAHASRHVSSQLRENYNKSPRRHVACLIGLTGRLGRITSHRRQVADTDITIYARAPYADMLGELEQGQANLRVLSVRDRRPPWLPLIGAAVVLISDRPLRDIHRWPVVVVGRKQHPVPAHFEALERTRAALSLQCEAAHQDIVKCARGPLSITGRTPDLMPVQNHAKRI